MVDADACRRRVKSSAERLFTLKFAVRLRVQAKGQKRVSMFTWRISLLTVRSIRSGISYITSTLIRSEFCQRTTRHTSLNLWASIPSLPS